LISTRAFGAECLHHLGTSAINDEDTTCIEIGDEEKAPRIPDEAVKVLGKDDILRRTIFIDGLAVGRVEDNHSTISAVQYI